MGEKHSRFAATRGERANSSGKPRRSTRVGGSRVDIDGVPLQHTKRGVCEMPDEFWEEFRDNPEQAVAKWTAE